MTGTPHYAQPPLDFLGPDFDPTVLQMAKALLPLWMHWRSNVKQVNVEDIDIMVDLFHQFQAGEVRFLIAFRHPSPNDAYCLMKLLWELLPKAARQSGKAFTDPSHVHFIYDRGIPLWAGRWVGWLASKLGSTSIQRGKIDRPGLKSARQLFANGPFPMAAAPEGANNGHTGVVSPFEPGIAQFGFWCVEDLLKAERSEKVVILPLGIQYSYEAPPWDAIAGLMTKMEHELGITTSTQPSSSSLEGHTDAMATALYPRLMGVGQRLLEIMESYYADFFKASFDKAEGGSDADAEFTIRLNRLMDTALRVAESFFHLAPKGTVIDRCRKIEHAGWDWIYREDLRPDKPVSAVERGLADRIAEEATLRMWHMRLVENFVAVTGSYVRDRPTVERFAETLLLLRDSIVRIKGKNPFPRPPLGDQVASLSVGQPVSVTDRWPAYTANRRQAVADLTAELQASVQSLIT